MLKGHLLRLKMSIALASYCLSCEFYHEFMAQLMLAKLNELAEDACMKLVMEV